MRRTPISFTRLVILLNPRSSNAARADACVTALKQAYPGQVLTKPVQKTEAANHTLLKATLRPGDILLPCGGDGTISSIVQSLLHPDMPKELRRTPVLPVGTGRMNDVARMLNGKHQSDPLFVLTHGRELPIYPITCVCTPLDTSRTPLTLIVIYSIGFGYAATACEMWNDPEFRARLQKHTTPRRTVAFFKEGSSILKDAEYFDITHRGKRQAVLDVTVSNGHILAGYWRLPARLSDRKFFYTIPTEKSFFATVRTIAQLLTNTYKNGELASSLTLTLHEPVAAQIGGEAFTVPAPCRVHIAYRKEPVTMIATSNKA